MKKFGEIEARYLKIGRRGAGFAGFPLAGEHRYFLCEVEGENAADKMKEREKKRVFNRFEDEQ